MQQDPDEIEMVDRIVETLERAIQGGELVPGKRISEQALASTLGVSRGLLREALRKLEARRLMERKAHSGIRLVDLSVDDLEQLLLVRESLEGAAARAAAQNASVRELAILRKFVAEEAERGEMLAFAPHRAKDGIHHLIARASKNRWLEKMLCDDLYGLLRAFRYTSVGFTARYVETREEHRRIVEAISSRDPERAEELMRLHNRKGRETLINELRAGGGETPNPMFLRPIPRGKKRTPVVRDETAEIRPPSRLTTRRKRLS